MLSKRRNIFYLTLLISIVFSSCVTQRNIEYLRDKDKSIKEFNEAQKANYRLKPNDELFIQISSLDDASANLFAGAGIQHSIYLGTIQPYGASLISYSIDKQGYLNLPVIGNLLVKDKTLSEVSEMLKDSLYNILNQPIVSIKLVNRYVTVLGEVRNPGHFVFTQDKFSIYDALGLAGDITDYGNRHEVLLVRNENGKNIRINVDLTDSEILSSEYYYVQPNDMVYVKPLRKEFWGLRQFPFTVVLSTITTAILIYSYIQ